MALSLATTLSYYKRPDVQVALLLQADRKEVGVRFGEGFGKRPDALFAEGDVLDFAKKRVTSFHASEELWTNPLHIKTGMSRSETAEIRVGWDLILDIDCPDWNLAKVVTALFIQALEDHGIRAVSVKFSGNKGFHIAVPFESFPTRFKNGAMKDAFPEAPRMVARYLVEKNIPETYTSVKDDTLFVAFGGKQIAIPCEELARRLGKSLDELFIRKCLTCGVKVQEATTKHLYICPKQTCGNRLERSTPLESPSCPRCGSFLLHETVQDKSSCDCAKRFSGRNDPRYRPHHVLMLNVAAVVEVDTILIAPRHLYRMPYSLHEKSGLASVPVLKEKVLGLSKARDWAKPATVRFDVPFLDRGVATAGEASFLFDAARSFVEGELSLEEGQERKASKEFEVPTEAIPEECFPPCINAMLLGLKDGRKRAMFTLINFLRGCGWSPEQIEEKLLAWNEKNDEKLREVELKGRLRYERTKKEVVPPHNCKRYYQDFGVCKPDSFCEHIKNPLQYAKRKAELLKEENPTGGRAKLSEEQKAMRRAHRERQKGNESGMSTSSSDDPRS
jgi:hypothetical protein